MNDFAIAHIRSITADPYPTPDYRVCHSPSDVADYLWSRDCVIIDGQNYVAIDTENTPDGEPYCLTISNQPGTGRLIYVRDKSIMEAFKWLYSGDPMLRKGGFHSLFHNYLHDVDQCDSIWPEMVTSQSGLLDTFINQWPFTDTYIRAYNLCLGGGGDEDESGAGRGLLSLKCLAYRHCNIRMTSFTDTVFPHSKKFVMEWLDTAMLMFQPSKPLPKCEWCNCEQSTHEPRGKTQRLTGPCLICPHCPKWKKGATPPKPADSKVQDLLFRKLNTLHKGLSLELEKGIPEDKEPINPWAKIKDWHEWDHRMLDGSVGMPPQPSIAHVPEEQLLAYATRDADATLRLFLAMKDMKPWIFYED